MTILILGSQTEDPHVSTVVDRLMERGSDFVVIDPWADERHYFIDYDIGCSNNGVRLVAAGHNLFDGKTLSAVWCRIKEIYGPRMTSLASGERRLVFREWLTFIDSLEYLVEGAFWINPVSLDKKWSLKPLQLALAKEVGFLIPDTIVSSNPERVLAFCESYSPIVCKTLTGYISDDQSVAAYTTKVSKNMLLEKKANISLAPSIFQSMVHKFWELRVTVVGDRIFAAKIDSQSDEGAKTDWRQNQEFLPYEKALLDKDTETKLRKFHKATGLVYGAYDLIVSEPNHEVVFLEVNPAGQWMWLEQAIPDFNISSAIADTLIDMSR
jgi:glutathione synthase/RimK-type ligase-like ATP-grasp enzyme